MSLTKALSPMAFSSVGHFVVSLWRRKLIRWSVFFAPTLMAFVYYVGVATDQYESEAKFVVRSAARPEVSGGLTFLVQLGFARSQDDSFIVQQFMTSRDAIDRLQDRLPLHEFFGKKGIDLIARYPSLLYGPSKEQFYRYFQHMVSVLHTDKTGISTLKVRAFSASDAYDIAENLLRLGEELVNRINQRLQTDAVSYSASELSASQQRLIDAQTVLTEFRNRELTIDPVRNAVSLAELVARFSAELGAVQAHIAEMKVSSSASPQLLGLQRKAAALEEQIAHERERIAHDDTGGLASRIVAYEKLMIEREFANRMVSAAEAEVMKARSEATRQLLYLERVVGPHKADYSTEPKRLSGVLTVFAANALLLLIGWLIFSGVREHAS